MATWEIPLSDWRRVIGILLFTLISIISTVARISPLVNPANDTMAAHVRPHAGFVKSILQIGFMQVSLEDWEVCRSMMDRALGLLEWLRGGNSQSENKKKRG